MKFLIWSNEHNAWWAPNSHGYVKSRSAAGRYSFDVALEIVRQANQFQGDDEKPNEAMVPETEK